MKRNAWLVLSLLMTVFVSTVFANSLPDFFAEPGVNPTRSLATDPNGVEQVDPLPGVLRLNHVDLVIPGNGGLDIVVQRNYHTSTAIGGAIGQLGLEYRARLGVNFGDERTGCVDRHEVQAIRLGEHAGSDSMRGEDHVRSRHHRDGIPSSHSF